MAAPTRPDVQVVLGMQGAQMPGNAVRGIGRWANDLVAELCRQHPEVVAGVSVDARLPLPRCVATLPLSVPVLVGDEPPAPAAGPLVFHALSLLEDLPLGRLWPPWARRPGVALVATLYDLLPLRLDGTNFTGPLRRLLQTRYELIRRAGATITISETTSADAAELLGMAPDRLFNAYAGVPAHFRPPAADRASTLAAIPAAHRPRPGFLLSIGNVDARKNLERLMRAYATLAPSARRGHQLVLTCSQDDGQRTADRLLELAADLGVGSDVAVLSGVDDPTVVALYQSCLAMVYPSLFEGLGLPLVEAMRCGAAVACSDVGSMVEVVRDPEARFDPQDVTSIAGVLHRLVTDGQWVERRRAAALGEAARFTWDRAARVAVAAYRQAAT